jgi:hypothetical protein
LLLTGCFYVDPVVDRPTVEVVLKGKSGTVLHHGDELQVSANLRVGNGAPRRGDSFVWTVVACPSDSGDGDCVLLDPPANAEQVTVVVPDRIRPGDAGFPPTRSIRAQVDVRDEYGIVIDGADRSARIYDRPTVDLEVEDVAGDAVTVGIPVVLRATYTVPSEDRESVALAWNGPFMPGVERSFADPDHIVERKQLMLMPPGKVNVMVAARYPAITVSAARTIVVLPDLPPCIAQWQPITPPPGAALPITGPTLFQVPSVVDDLDGYPRRLPPFGTATFAWSILPPGASTRHVLSGATGNTFELDPGAFTPGDIVELRVEVFDRNATAVACPDDQPTCAVGVSLCSQRQTWRMEIR